MKTILIITLVIFFIILGTQIAISYTTETRTEQQQYNVLEKEGAFEIRYYPEAVMATVVNEGSYGNSNGSSFRQLAGYIFGNNDSKKKIAMTAPVRMQQSDSDFYMSFVMPSQYDIDDLPVPVDSGVQIHTTNSVYTASITFSGYANKSIVAKVKEELTLKLQEMGLEHSGNFEILGYDPPYKVVNRKNEVLVELTNYTSREQSGM